jgi:hypothetical protein
MHGHVNLFVEGDNGPFAHRLQEALEHAGADALITRDNQTAISRLLNLKLSAAMVGKGHHNVAKYVHEFGMHRSSHWFAPHARHWAITRLIEWTSCNRGHCRSTRLTPIHIESGEKGIRPLTN